MFLLLMVPVFFLVSAAHGYLQLYAPSNRLITWIRSSPPRWRYVPLLTALAAATLTTMHMLDEAVAAGAPGWLSLVAMVLAWDTIKFALLAVHTTVRKVLRLFGCGFSRMAVAFSSRRQVLR
ncbi:hypothetical protein [Nocardioides sp.]|uniref:hypothetical protein n=1 Tax=Nocardioides sp. TaxID=35761 RepID=UPI002CD5E835|nr:hypothetical protein [Nocardioides sp.]HXH78413.1 hypothetical protein [Nocardioides sp.]